MLRTNYAERFHRKETRPATDAGARELQARLRRKYGESSGLEVRRNVHTRQVEVFANDGKYPAGHLGTFDRPDGRVDAQLKHQDRARHTKAEHDAEYLRMKAARAKAEDAPLEEMREASQAGFGGALAHRITNTRDYPSRRKSTRQVFVMRGGKLTEIDAPLPVRHR